MRLFEIFSQDPDLILHRQDNLLYFGVGLLAEDPLDPSSGRDYLLHGAAAEFLDFRCQRAVDSAKERVDRVALGRFRITRGASVWQVFQPHLRALLFLWSLVLIL